MRICYHLRDISTVQQTISGLSAVITHSEILLLCLHTLIYWVFSTCIFTVYNVLASASAATMTENTHFVFHRGQTVWHGTVRTPIVCCGMVSMTGCPPRCQPLNSRDFICHQYVMFIQQQHWCFNAALPCARKIGEGKKVGKYFGVNANRCYMVAGHARNSNRILPFLEKGVV